MDMETSYSKMRGKLFDGKSEKSIMKFGPHAPGEISFTPGHITILMAIQIRERDYICKGQRYPTKCLTNSIARFQSKPVVGTFSRNIVFIDEIENL